MKTKRTAILAFLLCAIMAIGIGFASVAAELKVSGRATLGEHVEGFIVEFTEASGTGASIVDGKLARVVVDGLDEKDETITVTYTVQNKSTNYAAELGTPSVLFVNDAGTQAVKDHLDIQASYDKTLLQPSEVATLTVTIKLESVVNDAGVADFNIILSATSKLPN